MEALLNSPELLLDMYHCQTEGNPRDAVGMYNEVLKQHADSLVRFCC